MLGQLPGVELVDHNADFARLVREGPLITPEFTFYERPVDWWQERLGAPVYLHAVAPSLIEIAPEPEMTDAVTALDAAAVEVSCTGSEIILNVAWAAPQTPTEDLSVFVHLLNTESAVIAQADQSAPVYGWRPLTSWLPGEAVRDVYALPRLAGAANIRFGLYHQLADGSFANDVERTVPVNCEVASE